jgi:ATP-dependent exoDNAse (exonuclease V) beta subunit
VRVVDTRREGRGRGAVTVLGVGPSSSEAMEAIVPDTPSHRAERNAAWGVLIHGLLEHAMRAGDGGVAVDDLRRLGLWLTIDHPELRPHVDAAVAIALEVTKADFWREAQQATERHVEVPFAIRLAAGERGPDGMTVERTTVLHGVIDLVHTSGDGWRVRDYKTGALPPAEMAEKYGVQLATYLDAWTRIAGQRLANA